VRLKGKAGDLGQLVSKRGSEDRGGELGRALRAGEGKEEGDGADRWARGVGGSGRERAGCASRAGASGEASWAAALDRASCWAEVGGGLRERRERGSGPRAGKEAGRTGLAAGLGQLG
jgi:hypothetical protein